MNQKNIFLVVILLFLIGDIYASTLSDSALWCHLFRVSTWLSMGLWYYQEQKKNFGTTQLIFLMSILFPIISSFSTYLFDYKLNTFIYISINILITILWSYVFKKVAKIPKLSEVSTNFIIHFCCFVLLFLVYFIFILFQSLTLSFKILIGVFITVFVYAGTLARLLQIDEKNKKLLMTSIILLVLLSIINSHHIFLQKKTWAYAVVRTITVVSRCLLIFVIIDVTNKASIATEED